jgi:RHS repeat-associated protein
MFDANGNVTEYVATNGTVKAHYEYSPFGATVAQSGDMADAFTHRFSTKPFDAETGSYYYGYRHYGPEWGCWFNRDPIEERGGLNLYGFVGNDAVNQIDYLGNLKKKFKKNPQEEMIFSGVFGSVEPGLILTYECKCKKVKYDLFFNYTLRMLSKSDTKGWEATPQQYPGESLENWNTWTIDQKYAFILKHEERHVYWWKVFFDATVYILINQESFEFKSNEACERDSEEVKAGVSKSYDDYNRKQRKHYFWEAGH